MESPLLNYIGIGKETTFGTPVSVNRFLKIFESDGIQINLDLQYVESIMAGSPAKNKEAYKGKVEYSGGYELPLIPINSPLIFQSALGNLTTETVETGVYKHTITEGFNKPSLSVEQKIGEIIKKFAGYRVKTFSLDGTAGEHINLSFEGLAKSQSDVLGSTPTFENHRVLNFADVSYFKIGNTDLKNSIEEFSIEYDNGLEGFYGLGSNDLVVSYPTPSEISGSITLLLNDDTKTIFNSGVNKDETSIEVLINGESLGNTNYSVKILIPRIVFDELGTNLSTDYNVLELSYNGLYDATNGLVKLEVVNNVNSY